MTEERVCFYSARPCMLFGELESFCILGFGDLGRFWASIMHTLVVLLLPRYPHATCWLAFVFVENQTDKHWLRITGRELPYVGWGRSNITPIRTWRGGGLSMNPKFYFLATPQTQKRAGYQELHRNTNLLFVMRS